MICISSIGMGRFVPRKRLPQINIIFIKPPNLTMQVVASIKPEKAVT